jgi:hypothetical protein
MRPNSDPVRIWLVLPLASLLFGCAGLTERGTGEPVHASEVEQVDTYVREPAAPAAERPSPAGESAGEPAPVLSAVPVDSTPAPPPPPQPAPSLGIRHVSGYRVQLYATREPEKARGFAESARESFGEKVYVEYLDPYYKVRVGDCLTREEARLLLDRAKGSGFDQAWITSTLVIRTENAR